MSYVIEIPLESGENLLVSALGQAPGGLGLAAGPDAAQTVVKAGHSLESALARLQPSLTKIAAQLKSHRPQEFSVEFELTASVEGGFIVASGGVEAAFKVAMVWKSPGDDPE